MVNAAIRVAAVIAWLGLTSYMGERIGNVIEARSEAKVEMISKSKEFKKLEALMNKEKTQGLTKKELNEKNKWQKKYGKKFAKTYDKNIAKRRTNRTRSTKGAAAGFALGGIATIGYTRRKRPRGR